MAAMQYGVDEGDTLKFYQSASMKEYEIVIDKVIDKMYSVYYILPKKTLQICLMFRTLL